MVQVKRETPYVVSLAMTGLMQGWRTGFPHRGWEATSRAPKRVCRIGDGRATGKGARAVDWLCESEEFCGSDRKIFTAEDAEDAEGFRVWWSLAGRRSNLDQNNNGGPGLAKAARPGASTLCLERRMGKFRRHRWVHIRATSIIRFRLRANISTANSAARAEVKENLSERMAKEPQV